MVKFFRVMSLVLSFCLNADWAEKTLAKMSCDEKIGQLFMIAAYVDRDFATREIANPGIIEEIDHYISRYHIGGIAYVGPSEILKQVALTNHYQEISTLTLLVAQDMEWGLSMRMKEALRFPKNIALGFLEDSSLVYKMGKEIGRQAKLIGVHMNLSPVLDVNIEPENLAINVRSFGSSPELVVEKGIAMIHGLQEAGVIASAKHFPGLGDITVDPHLGLPVSHHPKERFEKIEFYPFRKAIQAGVLSIQTEHLLIPALDAENPASLSPEIVEKILKKEMGFEGVVLSGALRMKALTQKWSDEEIAVKAFLAGSDILLMPQDLSKAFAALKKAREDGKITQEQIDSRVLKILRLKERMGLHHSKIVALPRLEQFKTPEAKVLKARLYQAATKVMRDANHLLPLSSPSKIAYVQLGESPSSEYLEALSQKLKMEVFQGENLRENELEKYDRILLAVYPLDPRRIEQIRLQGEEQLQHFRVHGLLGAWIKLLKKLEKYEGKTVVTLFGNPFGLPFFERYSSLIIAQESDPDAQNAAAQALTSEDPKTKG